MAQSIVRGKSHQFAIRIVKLAQYLKTKHEFILSDQILRSGTSIGANIEEALSGFSRKDFLYKLTISLKETAETTYWLMLLYEGKYISDIQYESLKQDAEELKKLLSSIILTTKTRNSQL